jgi:Flp pilus assembly protein TadG
MNAMKKQDERGVAAAEFALLLPVFLTLVLGTIEFGMMMYGREVVTNAAREGARAGIVLGPPKRTAGEITAISNAYLTSTGVSVASVTFNPTGAGGANPATLTMAATYRYPFLFSYIPALLGIPNPLPINTQVVMRHE